MEDKKSNNSFLSTFAQRLLDISTLKKIIKGLLIVGTFTFLLVYLHLDVFKTEYRLTGMVHSILGLALGLLLVFRTNTAYDKWWEGRKLLGSLVNNSRNLANKINAYLVENSDKIYLKNLVASYPFALRNHLRNDSKSKDLQMLPSHFLKHLEKKQHTPNAVTQEIYRFITQKHQEGSLNDMQFLSLDNHIKELTDIIGACERIKNTPLPRAYNLHLSQFLNLYMFTLPLPLVHELAYWSVPVIMVIYYALAGVKNIGAEIEEPFGTDANDLPVDEICNRICANIEEIFENVPQPEAIDMELLEK